MVKVNSALILYFTAFILYVFAVLIGSDNLELFTKPIILPSIYYFYYISVRGKIDYLFSFSVLSFVEHIRIVRVLLFPSILNLVYKDKIYFVKLPFCDMLICQ